LTRRCLYHLGRNLLEIFYELPRLTWDYIGHVGNIVGKIDYIKQNRELRLSANSLFLFCGDPKGNRTPVSGVRERFTSENSVFHPLFHPLKTVFDHQKPSKKPSGMRGVLYIDL